MAAAAQPDPTQGGAPGADSGAPSGAPASPEMMMMNKLLQACKGLSQQNPVLSAGLDKAVQGIQEAMTASVVGGPSSPQPASQNPPL